MSEKQYVIDCGSHSCRFAIVKTGMRTNGPCRCKDSIIDLLTEKDRELKRLRTLVEQMNDDYNKIFELLRSDDAKKFSNDLVGIDDGVQGYQWAKWLEEKLK